MTLLRSDPCEHGDTAPHGIGINARIAGRVDCPGGTLEEVTINYTRAMSAADEAGILENGHNIHGTTIRHIIDAALGGP